MFETKKRPPWRATQASGTPPADALSQRHDIGLDVSMLVMEKRSGYDRLPVWISSTMSKQAVRLGQIAQFHAGIGRSPATRRPRPGSAPAINADGPVIDQPLHRGEIVQQGPWESPENLGARNRGFEGFLARCRQSSASGPAMESAFECDDLISATAVAARPVFCGRVLIGGPHWLPRP